MAHRLRNITITLEEDVARWARIEAAKQDTSVSRLLGRVLKGLMQQEAERTHREDEYDRAMQRLLQRKPYVKSSGKYPSREEIHERGSVR